MAQGTLEALPGQHVVEGWPEAHLKDAEQALEGMIVRIHAAHAHHQSLHGAAQGLHTIGRRLDAVLRAWVEQRGWSAESRMARMTLEAMEQQMQVVLEPDPVRPLEEYREGVRHVLFRVLDSYLLLALAVGIDTHDHHPASSTG